MVDGDFWQEGPVHWMRMERWYEEKNGVLRTLSPKSRSSEIDVPVEYWWMWSASYPFDCARVTGKPDGILTLALMG